MMDKNKTQTPPRKGQSLVEMAIMLPILVFMLIGLFEVGYAIWGYMTLLNVDREATRFSTIAGALDYNTRDIEEVGYREVVTHTLISNAGQLRLEEYLNNGDADDPNAAIIITHLLADTQEPCEPIKEMQNAQQQSVEDARYASCVAACSPDFTDDDLILHPGIDGYEHYQFYFPDNGTPLFTSKLDPAAEAQSLKTENDAFNCKLKSKAPNASPSSNGTVTVEMFYEQPQLLGFPLFAWILNPLPLYVQTTMRVQSNDLAQCELWPIVAEEQIILNGLNTGSIINLLGSTIGRPSGSNGWASWNPDESSQTYLVEEFRNPRLATNDFTDPYDPSDGSDHDLEAGDWVAANTGVINSNDVRDALFELMDQISGRVITIPVFDAIGSQGANGRYHIAGFAKVKITEYSLPPGGGGYINADVIEYPTQDICLGNGI